MKPLQLLILGILLIPFAEIYLLLAVGSVLGAATTIFFVVATAVFGAFLLKQQGFTTLQRFKEHLAQGQLPAQEMLEGLFILIGGALLLTPGFITDALGLVCLIPSVRKNMVIYLLTHQVLQNNHFTRQKDNVLEGEFSKEE